MTKTGQVRLARAKAHDERMLNEAEQCLERGDVREAVKALQRVSRSQVLLAFLGRAEHAKKLTAKDVLEICATRAGVSVLPSRAFTKAQIEELVDSYEAAIQAGRIAQAGRIRDSLDKAIGVVEAQRLLEERLKRRRADENPNDALARIAREEKTRKGNRRR